MRQRDFLQWGEQALGFDQFELAEEIARYQLRQSPSHLLARILLGCVYLRTERLEEAEEQLRQALDMDPEGVSVLLSYADVLEGLGREQALAAVLRRAFECDPTRMAVKQRLLALQTGLGDRPRGNGILTRTGLARTHLRCGLLEHAIAELRTVLEETPSHWSVQVALMEAHWLNGERQAASRLADEIMREHPNCLKAILVSADVRAHMGLIDQARQLFERARQIDPDFTLARALYPANGPSRLPLPNNDAEIDVPVDFLQRIETTLAEAQPAKTQEVEDGDSRRRAAEARARTVDEDQAAEGEQRVLVTPVADDQAEPVASPAPAASVEPVADEPVAEQSVAEQSVADQSVADKSAGQTSPAEREEETGQADSPGWDALLTRLEREGGQLDAAALDEIAAQLEDLAVAAPNSLEAWQRLGDVYQRIGETERAMRAYMRALRDTSTATDGDAGQP